MKTYQCPLKIKQFCNKHLIKISFAIMCITLIVFAIFFFQNRFYDSNATIESDVFGQFGDVFGGVVGTILTFISIVLLYKTLTSQESSINRQSKEFERQQIESHFFDLLKIHRENTNAITKKYPTFFEDSVCYLNEFFYRFIKQKKTSNSDFKLVVAISYLYFYYGSSPQSRNTIKNILKTFTEIYYPKVTDGELNTYIEAFSKSKNLQLFCFAKKKIENNENTKTCQSLYMSRFRIDEIIFPENTSDQYIYIPNNEPILGTYFRHLYQTVKYINEIDDKVLPFKEGVYNKYNYVKTLRAQLSSYEQALLFWDSVSPLGYVWEMEEKSKSNPSKDKYLMTNYQLLKNIPDELIFKKTDDVKIEQFYPDIKWDWKKN